MGITNSFPGYNIYVLGFQAILTSIGSLCDHLFYIEESLLHHGSRIRAKDVDVDFNIFHGLVDWGNGQIYHLLYNFGFE